MAVQNNSDIFRTLKITDEIGFTNNLITNNLITNLITNNLIN